MTEGGEGGWKVATKEKLKCQLLPTFLLDGYLGCWSTGKCGVILATYERRRLR